MIGCKVERDPADHQLSVRFVQTLHFFLTTLKKRSPKTNGGEGLQMALRKDLKKTQSKQQKQRLKGIKSPNQKTLNLGCPHG